MAGRIWTKEEWEEHVERIKKSEHLIPLSVLDKIRAEIEDKISAYDDRNISEYKDCLDIIDKYKAESEDKGNGRGRKTI